MLSQCLDQGTCLVWTDCKEETTGGLRITQQDGLQGTYIRIQTQMRRDCSMIAARSPGMQSSPISAITPSKTGTLEKPIEACNPGLSISFKCPSSPNPCDVCGGLDTPLFGLLQPPFG